MGELIENQQARRILMRLYQLDGSGGEKLRGQALHDLVQRLGYVQLDFINVVERAHHHILFSRGQSYRQSTLKRLAEKERLLFEHWTHDASIIPTAFFPYWRHRFEQAKERLHDRFEKFFGNGFASELEQVLERIRQDGPAMARDFELRGKREGGWWNWHPSKTALEYLWHTGELAITRRDGFQKVYDLTERVIPDPYRKVMVDKDAFVDWACREALMRLGFGTRGEIVKFWNLLAPAQVDAWLAANREQLATVKVGTVEAGKPRNAYALASQMESLHQPVDIADRVKILSPFDPMLRDRARTERIFGFYYRIEVFVPKAKRQYGYYVYPVMRGTTVVGRIDMKADRAADRLAVRKFWPEKGVRSSNVLKKKMEAEIERLRRFAGVAETEFSADWFR